MPEDQRMQFRIGVHLGDVIQKSDGTDLRATGSTSPHGSSDWPQPRWHLGLGRRARRGSRASVTAQFVDQGEQRVKNIDHPVRALRLPVPAAQPPASQPARPV